MPFAKYRQSNSIPNVANSVRLRSTTYRSLETSRGPVRERSVIQEELITHLTSFRIHKTSLFSDSHIITDHC